MKFFIVELALIVGISAAFPNLPALYAPAPDVLSWNSGHWSSSPARDLTPRDWYDTTGLSQRRGKDPVLSISDGVLRMSGANPRLYLNPWIKPNKKHWTLKEERERLATGKPKRFYKNTEVTVYYRRSGRDGAAYAGLVVGCRSSPNGHTSSKLYHEDAHTYYVKFRHDGGVQFAKEVTHPELGVQTVGDLFSGQPLPENEWIGMKFIVYNLDSSSVKLEVYIDRTSGGEEDKLMDVNNWKKVGDTIDDGTNFAVSTIGEVDGKSAITEGGGVVFIRNTMIAKAEYKFLQVTEIKTPVQPLFVPDNY
jgi:hypothetical protein